MFGRCVKLNIRMSLFYVIVHSTSYLVSLKYLFIECNFRLFQRDHFDDHVISCTLSFCKCKIMENTKHLLLQSVGCFLYQDGTHYKCWITACHFGVVCEL